jgi:hypothetical protein
MTAALAAEPAGWAWMWDMVKAPAYYRRLAEQSDLGRGQTLDMRVAMLLRRRERTAQRLAGLTGPAPAEPWPKPGSRWDAKTRGRSTSTRIVSQ